MNRQLLLALLLTAPLASAQNLAIRDFAHARSIGMGGAYRATGLGADSVGGNPAATGLLKVYQIELAGAYDFPHQDGFGSVALRDSQTSDVAAGVGYHFIATGGPGARTFGHLSTLSLAVPIADAIVVGVSGNYLYQSGASPANAGTMNAGLMVRPAGGLVIGIGAHNIIDTRNPELDRYYSGSLAWLSPAFTIALDVRSTLRSDNGKPQLNLGGEYFISQLVFVRAGYAHDFLLNYNSVSAGAGIFTSGAGFDISYRHEFGNTQTRLLAATLRFQM